jgi:glycosyltransferase involved in cell wall biosynthesis
MNPLRLALSFLRYRASALKEVVLAIPVLGGAMDAVFDFRKARFVLQTGLLFVHIPKNAGTSISHVLYGSTPGHHRARFFAQSRRLRNRSYTSFAVIRDPVDRCLSNFFYLRNGGSALVPMNYYWKWRLRHIETFPQFVDFISRNKHKINRMDPAIRTQSYFICDLDGAPVVDRVFSMPEQWPQLRAFLADNGVGDIEHLNKTERVDLVVDAELIGKIEDVYAEDVALYRSAPASPELVAADHGDRAPTLEPIRPSRRRIAWLSHRYGYNGRLMYYGRIFTEFVRAFPKTRIYVDSLTQQSNVGLASWLFPIQFLTIGLRRSVRGVAYETELRIPNPLAAVDLLRFSPALCIVIEFTPISVMGMILVRLIMRRKVLLLIENDPGFRGLRAIPWIQAAKGWVARRATRVMTNNASGLAYVRDDLKVPAERIIVAPYLTSQPAAPARCGTASKSAPSDGRLVFVFVNSIRPRKGLIPLLHGLAALPRADRREILLRVYGDGPDLPEARRVAAQLGISPLVEFRGHVPWEEVGEALADADVFVSPSLSDYRSLTGFEALSFGLPILLSRYDGAHGEVVSEGVNGFLIAPDDPKDLAAKLAWCVRHRDRLPAMGAASLGMARRFSVAAIAGNLQDAVTECLASDGPAALGASRGPS